MRVRTDPTTGRFLVKTEGAEEAERIKRIEGRSYVAGVGWALPISRRTLRLLRQIAVVDAAAEQYLNPPVAAVRARYGSRTPYGYQVEGISWLGARTSALLYDPPGTGKTLQAVAWAYDQPRTVVVAPKPVLSQWVAEAQEMGVRWCLNALTKRRWEPVSGKDGGWYVVNYESVGLLPDQRWDALIVDESTYIRNRKAQRTKAVLALGSRASRIIALSGTPIVNRPLDLWSTLVLLRKRAPHQFWDFVMRYTGAFKTPYGWDLTGATHVDELGEEISHYALRRERPPLPPLTITKIEMKPRPEHAKMIDIAEEALVSALLRGQRASTGMGEMQALRVVSAMSKTEPTAEWIANHLATGGGQVLVFSGFKDPLKRLAELLGDQYTQYHGDVPDADRAGNKAAFQAGAKRVMGMTYEMGTYGHNLQQATTVMLLDPPWTSVELEQAVDRAWRSGQAEPVQAVLCLSGHPIESRMFYAVEHKESIAEALNAYITTRTGGPSCRV